MGEEPGRDAEGGGVGVELVEMGELGGGLCYDPFACGWGVSFGKAGGGDGEWGMGWGRKGPTSLPMRDPDSR